MGLGNRVMSFGLRAIPEPAASPACLILTDQAHSRVIRLALNHGENPSEVFVRAGRFSSEFPGENNAERVSVFTTFDRYLLKRYLHSFVILFISMYGLFVVIDGFTNVDGFQEGLQSPGDVLTRMAWYYCFQSFQIFDQVASILSVIAVMTVFALMQRNSEFHPMLAAGVPTLRLLFPVMVGTMIVNALVIANQELVIPQIARQLQAPRNGKAAAGTSVEPLYDRTRIHIDGKALHVVEQRLEKAKFLLPQPDLARDLTTLKAREAIYLPETNQQPSGWLLRNVKPTYDEIPLTEAGRKFVRRTNNPADLFVVTDVSFDQLSNRTKNFRYLSTLHLIRRINNSSTGLTSLRGQTLFFHTRLVRPILNVIAVLLIVPIILRRESRGLVTNMAVCALLMGTLYGVAQVFSYLGQVNIMAVDMAAWSPVIFNGSFGVWIYGFTQT